MIGYNLDLFVGFAKNGLSMTDNETEETMVALSVDEMEKIIDAKVEEFKKAIREDVDAVGPIRDKGGNK